MEPILLPHTADQDGRRLAADHNIHLVVLLDPHVPGPCQEIVNIAADQDGRRVATSVAAGLGLTFNLNLNYFDLNSIKFG